MLATSSLACAIASLTPVPQISFTFILPLFPKLLEFYRDHEASRSAGADSKTVLSQVLYGLNAYKNSFAKPINDRYDIVLLGGALGSLFSFLQALASPIIGVLSDKFGRRTALLWSMAGNILSVALWVAATDFRTFLLSRVVGGLSEGNVQLAMAIATDISDETQRGATMALVGVCFSIAFTFGPALGAWLSTITMVSANPFAAAAAFSLFLIVTETIYLYFALPETLPSAEKKPFANGGLNGAVNGTANGNGVKKPEQQKPRVRTNSHTLLNATHFLFILFFSGMEFSLPFMTYDLFSFGSKDTGRLLGFIGLVASLLQGSVVRRTHPLKVVQMGVLSCLVAFILLGRVESQKGLYAAAALLAVTSATVVTGLNSLSSFEAGSNERGEKLGNHRSFGKLYLFCSTRNANANALDRSSRTRSWAVDLLLPLLVGRKRSRIRSRRRGHGCRARARLRRAQSPARYRSCSQEEGRKGSVMSFPHCIECFI
jgi:MFS family permease